MARDEDRERKRRLNKMMKDLQKVDPADILVYLTCLSDMRKEQIRRIWKNDGAMIAAGELFEELPKRENWYSTLVTALREIDRDDLADKLEGPEKKSPPSGSSQSVATGQTSHNASVTQNQGAQHSPPATNPHPPARQERSPEPEASVSAGLPDIATEKGVPQKGAEKDTKPSGPEENAGQQSQAGASLPMPVQERIQTSASDLAPGGSGSGGPVASSPSSGQRRHTESESDECNISSNGRPTHMQAEETAALKPGNPSPTAASGGRISVRPRDDRQAGRENIPGRMEGEVESGGERERKESREEGRDKKDLNFQNHLKNLNIQKVKDPPGDKMNNLSPSTDVPELFSKKENKDKSQSQSAVENTDDVCPTEVIHTLSSVVRDEPSVDEHCEDEPPVDKSREISDIRSSHILISPDPQQTEEGTGVQGADRDGGTRDVAIGNQDSLLMRCGNVIRGYIPGLVDFVSEGMLKQ